MNRFKATLVTACSLGMAALSPWAHGQATVPAYTFVDLGTYNNSATQAMGINDAGQITGHSHDGTNLRAFRITPVYLNGELTWFQGSGYINSLMALVTTDASHPWSESWGINNKGELAGQALGSGYTLPQNAFFWRANLSGVKLSTNQSTSYAINDISSITGSILPPKGGGNLETIWRVVNGSFVPTTIPRSTAYSSGIARGLNNLDQVVGSFNPSNGTYSQPYVWLPAPAYGLFAGTNFLPVSQGGGGQAFAMNDTGSIIGVSFSAGGQDQHATIWTPGTNGYSVSSLASSEWTASYANGLNNPDTGQLLKVVGSAFASTGDRAIVWDSATGTRDLNLLTVNAPQGSLRTAGAVNKGGLIVGNYSRDGSTGWRAFLLVPNATLPAASTAPLSPSQVSGIDSFNQVPLSWTDGSNDENGFQISRSQDGVTYKQIGWVGTDTAAYTDTFEDQSYTPAFKYIYRISAFNVAGYSTGATLEVITSGAPLAPSSVKALASTAPIRINLTWKNNTNTQDFAAIERSDNGGSFAPLTILTSATVTSYSDTAVVASHTYYYRLRSHSTNGFYSAYSAVVSATTPRK
jgi:hypothetical protein